MFSRRDLLKPLTALVAAPLFVKGKNVARVLKVEPNSKYLVFVDGYMLDARVLADDAYSPLPADTPIYTVKVPSSRSIDDAIRIFKLKE